MNDADADDDDNDTKWKRGINTKIKWDIVELNKMHSFILFHHYFSNFLLYRYKILHMPWQQNFVAVTLLDLDENRMKFPSYLN